MTKGLRALALGAVLTLAVVTRLRGANHDLPFVYDPDEPLFVGTAIRMLEARRLDPGWYGGPATITFYLLAVAYTTLYLVGRLLHRWVGPEGFREFYQTDPSVFYQLARSVNILFGVASVYLVYRIGRRILGETGALVASAFFALSPLSVAFSQNARMDTPLVFFLLLAFNFALSVADGDDGRAYLGAGAAAGLAVLCKWPGVVVVPVLLIAHFMNPRRRPALLLSGVLGFLICSVVLAPWFVVKVPQVLSDLRREARAEHLSHTGAGFLSNAYWYLTVALNEALSMIGLLLAAAGFVFAILSKSKGLRLLAFMPLFFFSFVCALSLRWERWILPVVPFACVLAALTIQETARRLAVQPRASTLAGWMLPAAVVLPLAAATLHQGSALLRPSRITIARNWIVQHVPNGSRVLVERYTPSLPFDRYQLYYITEQGELRRADAHGLGRNFEPRGAIGRLSREEEIRANGIEFAALSSLFDRYTAAAQEYPAEAARYQQVLEHGAIVYDGGPPDGDARGPRVFIVQMARP
jgi:hypothetical protein